MRESSGTVGRFSKSVFEAVRRRASRNRRTISGAVEIRASPAIPPATGLITATTADLRHPGNALLGKYLSTQRLPAIKPTPLWPSKLDAFRDFEITLRRRLVDVSPQLRRPDP